MRLAKIFCAAGLLTVVLAGCAKSVQVKSTFPDPVLEPLPLSVGVRLPADLTDFIHTEDPLTDAEWEIDVGEANAAMFRTIFGALFENTRELSPDGSDDLTGLGLDAIIEPRLNELEFAVPAHSGNDQYTVWLQYFLRVLTPEGDEIVDWEVTAYGQQDQGRMGLGDEAAMRAAAVRALRDAGANIALNFSKVPEIESALLSPPEVAAEQAGADAGNIETGEDDELLEVSPVASSEDSDAET